MREGKGMVEGGGGEKDEEGEGVDGGRGRGKLREGVMEGVREGVREGKGEDEGGCTSTALNQNLHKKRSTHNNASNSLQNCPNNRQVYCL